MEALQRQTALILRAYALAAAVTLAALITLTA